MKAAHVLDLDDGPGGGGGAALFRALRVRGVPCTATVVGFLAGGVRGAEPGLHFLHDGLPEDLGKAIPEASRIVLGTRRLAQRLARRSAEDVPVPLRSFCGRPSGVEAVRRAEARDIPVVPFTMLSEAPRRAALMKTYRGSHVLDCEGRLIAARDGEEAWFRLRELERRGRFPAAVVGAPGARRFSCAVVIRNRVAVAAGAVVLDDATPAGRTGLARTVTGRPWIRFVDEVAEILRPDGIHTVEGLLLPGENRPRFTASHPVPPDWLPVAGKDGGLLLSAWLDDAEPDDTIPFVEAGRFYAAVPIDEPVDARTLMERAAP